MTRTVHDISWRLLNHGDDERIYVEEDAARLRTATRKCADETDDNKGDGSAAQLLDLLEQGNVVPAHELPCSVATIGSQVVVSEPHWDRDAVVELTLRKPKKKKSGKVSVLSPLGMALLGLRVNDEVEFRSPGGRRRVAVSGIAYQPQAFGHSA